MINLSNANKELCFTDSVEKPFYLYIYRPVSYYENNEKKTKYKFFKIIDNFESESLEYTDGILEDSTFAFGSFVLPEIKIKWINDGIDYNGMACIPVQKIGDQYVKYFEGFIKDTATNDNGTLIEATIVTSVAISLDDDVFSPHIVDYLQSAGDAYINLGEYNGFNIEIECEFTSLSSNPNAFSHIMGSLLQKQTNGTTNLTQRMYVSVQGNQWMFGYGTGSTEFWKGGSVQTGIKYNIRARITPKGIIEFYYKKSTDTNYTEGDVIYTGYDPIPQNLYLFARNSNIINISNSTTTESSTPQTSPLIIYSVKIYSTEIGEGNTIKKILVPYQNAYGVLGLYDELNSEFYPPADEHTFTTDAYDGFSGEIGSFLLENISGKHGISINQNIYLLYYAQCSIIIPYLLPANYSEDFKVKDALRMMGEFLGASIRLKKQVLNSLSSLENDIDYPTNELCFIKLSQNAIYDTFSYPEYINSIYELPYHIKSKPSLTNLSIYGGIDYLPGYVDISFLLQFDETKPILHIEKNVFIDSLRYSADMTTVLEDIKNTLANVSLYNCTLETPYPVFLEGGDFCKIPINANEGLFKDNYLFVGGIASDGINSLVVPAEIENGEQHIVLKIRYRFNHSTDYYNENKTIFEYGDISSENSIAFMSEYVEGEKMFSLNIGTNKIVLGQIVSNNPTETINMTFDIKYEGEREENSQTIASYSIAYSGDFNGADIFDCEGYISTTQNFTLFPDIDLELFAFELSTNTTGTYRYIPAIDNNNNIGLYDIYNDVFVSYAVATANNTVTEYILVPMTSINVNGINYMSAQIENNLSTDEV